MPSLLVLVRVNSAMHPSGKADITSMISSGTLTLDEITYPNAIGTTGQVITTAGQLYFADATTNTDI